MSQYFWQNHPTTEHRCWLELCNDRYVVDGFKTYFYLTKRHHAVTKLPDARARTNNAQGRMELNSSSNDCSLMSRPGAATDVPFRKVITHTHARTCTHAHVYTHAYTNYSLGVTSVAARSRFETNGWWINLQWMWWEIISHSCFRYSEWKKSSVRKSTLLKSQDENDDDWDDDSQLLCIIHRVSYW